MREAIPVMKAQRAGRIINITSLNALLALPNFSTYCASKFALEALGLSARYELIRHGVRVTSIAPGAIAHDGGGERAKPLPHRSARERFWIIRTLMPMITQETICRVVAKTIERRSPPAEIIVGRDAWITTSLQRFLPRVLWDRLLTYVWSRQSEQ